MDPETYKLIDTYFEYVNTGMLSVVALLTLVIMTSYLIVEFKKWRKR